MTDTELDMTQTKPDLRVYKLWEDAHLPVYGSELAACFDLKASLRYDTDIVKVYDKYNNNLTRGINKDSSVVLYPRERMLVPTGLVFDLYSDESLRLHPRSGLSLKDGIVLANCEGVVDADYVQQTFVMLYNMSEENFLVRDGDRIAQGEVVTAHQYKITQIDHRPEEKTSRKGGFGSTGV